MTSESSRELFVEKTSLTFTEMNIQYDYLVIYKCITWEVTVTSWTAPSSVACSCTNLKHCTLLQFTKHFLILPFLLRPSQHVTLAVRTIFSQSD